MVDLHLYFVFLITTLMLVIVPGPSAMTAAAQGANHRAGQAFIGVLGIASGDAIFFALSATGIASLIVASSLLFTVIKWAGIVYLLYLGLTALFSRAGMIRITPSSVPAKRSRLFYQGLVVQLSNPKALMYFSALLPQFIDPAEPVMQQMLLMGGSLVLADIVVYSLFSHMGDRMARKTVSAGVVNAINKVAGVTLITTGIRMAALETH